MKFKTLQWLGIVLILETGLLHFFTSQAQYEKAAYLGYAFVAYSLIALFSAFGIYHRWVGGWTAGLVISAISVIGFVCSRTLGLPGIAVQEWLNPYGIVSMSVEGLFITLCLLRPWRISSGDPSLATNSRLSYVLPVAGLFIVLAVSGFAYRWDAAVIRAYGHHVGSLDQVCSTPVTSFAEMEERYGVQVSLVATSMMDSIVDVRLKVIDPQKAAVLLKSQAALLVDQKALILAPHRHQHGAVLRDKFHFVFFPTLNNTVHTGSQVNLVFGSVRSEAVKVK